MKQQVLIISGAIIIFLLVAVWVYLLFFGTPKGVQDVFSDLGIVGEETNEIIEEEIVTENTETEDQELRQLTTKEVAGFVEVNEPDRDLNLLPIIYYAEKGTGHIFSINLETGEENRISGTTVPETNVAKISPNKDWVVFGKHSHTKTFPLVIGKLNTDSEMEIEDFLTTVGQFTLSAKGDELMYTTLEQSGLSAHNYNLNTGKSSDIFDLPFFEATIQWGSGSNDTHYAYPKPSYLFEGYLYKIKNKQISRLPASGFGFSALTNDSIIAYNKTKNQTLLGNIYNYDTKTNKEIPLVTLPEKCVLGEKTANLICAQDQETSLSFDFPDNWYKGNFNFKDSLWLINGEDLSATLLVDIFAKTNREVDAINLAIGNTERAVYFINKIDNTLWMYEL